MLLSEAKNFFMDHDGFEFHMLREDPEKYAEFKKLNLDDMVKEEWRQEIIFKYINEYYVTEDKNKRWVIVGKIIDILPVTTTNKEENGMSLLKILSDGNTKLDTRQKILIMEHMAGRDDEFKGGIRWLCMNTSLENEMVDIVTAFSDFSVKEDEDYDGMGWEDVYGRYMRALGKIKIAIRKYGKHS